MECIICKYSTTKLSNFNKHLETESHISKKLKHDSFIDSRRKNKIKRENKIFKELSEQILEQTKILQEQNNLIREEFTEKLEKIEEENNKTNEKVDEISNKVTDIKTGVKKLVDCVDFLTEYSNDANVIAKLTEQEISEMLKIDEYKKNKKTKFALQELLLCKIEGKQLPEHLCNIIANHYIKKNPLEQGLWASDTARLTYVIMQLSNDNKKQWVRDKKGELFKELIANPLVMKIRDLFNEYVEHKSSFEEIESDEEESILDKMKKIQHAYELNSSIIANNLNKNITKLTASKISLNKKKNEISKNN